MNLRKAVMPKLSHSGQSTEVFCKEDSQGRTAWGAEKRGVFGGVSSVQISFALPYTVLKLHALCFGSESNRCCVLSLTQNSEDRESMTLSVCAKLLQSCPVLC